MGRAHMPWALYTLAEGLLASYDRQEGLGSLRAPQGKCRSPGGCGGGRPLQKGEVLRQGLEGEKKPGCDSSRVL